MRFKTLSKSIFVTMLSLILVSLSSIAFKRIDDQDLMLSQYSIKLDYRIIDSSETCADSLEEIYQTDTHTYYLPCEKSGDLYLQWNNGLITYLKDDLNKSNVSIESLIKHGLEVIISEKQDTVNVDKEVVENEE